MQTFSNMQRSLTYQSYLRGFGLLLLFLVYESMSSIYLLLPPLLGVLFFYYMQAMKRQSFPMLIFITLLLLIFEADKGYLVFTTLIYFTFLYRFVVPKIRKYIECRECLGFIYVVLAYVGFWFFSLLLNQVLWIPLPSMDWHVLYYIIIEFMVITLL